LTQVANRRCFNDRLLQEWLRLAEQQELLTLILFDIDEFKRYNDHYGHLGGDDCLLKIAQAVYRSIRKENVTRPIDLVARYGGEEFVVLLPHTNLEGGIQIAQRIQQVIYDLAIPHAQSQVKDIVTVSLGVASLIPTLDVNPDTLIAYADEALYHAKQQGRDRVEIFHNSPS